MDRTFQRGSETLKVSASLNEDRITLASGDGPREYVWEELNPGEYLLKKNGKQHHVVVARKGKDRWIWVDGRIHALKVVTGRPRAKVEDEGSLTAPMNGTVLKILVEPGQRVRKKQPLVMLEAMKMQYEIHAPRAGVVRAVNSREGAQVQGGQALITLDE